MVEPETVNTGADAEGGIADEALAHVASALDAAYQDAVERGPERLRRLGPGAVVYALRERILRLREVGMTWAEITTLLKQQNVLVHQKTVESVIRPLEKERGTGRRGQHLRIVPPDVIEVPPAKPPAPAETPTQPDESKKTDSELATVGGGTDISHKLPPFRGKERER